MNDTMRIERPFYCRRHEDVGGRLRKDARGNIIRVRTRAGDAQDDFIRSWAELAAKMDGRVAG